MRKIQSMMVAAMLLLATAMPSFAQERPAVRIPVEVAGTTPDSLLYGLDVALDRISLLIASLEGAQAHARKGLEIADERLAESEVMAEIGNFEAMASAEHEHDQMLAVVKERIKDIEHANATREIEMRIELERDVTRHRGNIEGFSNRLELRIEIEGGVTPEQIALITSILNSLRVRTGEVEIEIEIRKGETRIEIMQQTGMSEEEVDTEIRGIERRMGLVEAEMGRQLNAALTAVNREFSLPPTGFTVVSKDIDIEDDTLSITKTLTTNETVTLSKLKDALLLRRAVNWEGDVSLTEDSLDFTMEKDMDIVDVRGVSYTPSVTITVSVTVFAAYTEMHYTIGITLEELEDEVEDEELEDEVEDEELEDEEQ